MIKSPQKKMTPVQVKKYCSLVNLFRDKNGRNPDVNEISEIDRKVRKVS